MNILSLLKAARERTNNNAGRSAWSHGVNDYANDFIDTLEEEARANRLDADKLKESNQIEKILLNGAKNWYQYSWDGSALCYDYDIAQRLCTPSELKKTRNGERRPNSREEWLDTQARALYQAADRVKKAIIYLQRHAEEVNA